MVPSSMKGYIKLVVQVPQFPDASPPILTAIAGGAADLTRAASSLRNAPSAAICAPASLRSLEHLPELADAST